MRTTHQRLVIFEEVARSSRHPDADAVYRAVRRRIPTISLDTVYRTLWLFKDLGLVATLGPSRERTRFDGNVRRHHHFICNRCGTAIDFCSPEFDALRIPDDLEAVGPVETVHVELRGLCSDCLKAGPADQGT
ncbi:MAG: Fur family transcriptional regulator [Armatimonadota bacterium]